MAAKYVGTVKSPRGKSYDVRWDPNSRDVYVSYAGGTKCGKQILMKTPSTKQNPFFVKRMLKKKIA